MCIGYTFRATPLNVLYHSACAPRLITYLHAYLTRSLPYFLGALPARAAASDRARREAAAAGKRSKCNVM